MVKLFRRRKEEPAAEAPEPGAAAEPARPVGQAPSTLRLRSGRALLRAGVARARRTWFGRIAGLFQAYGVARGLC